MNDARRLLVITYHFGPDGPVGGLRWFGITKYLARLGWKVSVITAAPSIGTDAAIDAQVAQLQQQYQAAAKAAQLRLTPLRLALGLGTAPGGVKAALTLLGRSLGPSRLPVAPLAPDKQQKMRAVLEQAELLHR